MENDEENRTAKSAVRHLPLKTILSLILGLLFGAAAIVTAYALEKQRAALTVSLIFLHIGELLSLGYSYFSAYLQGKLNPKLRFLRYLYWIVLLIVLFFLALETYFIGKTA
jgi:hypothetical protein